MESKNNINHINHNHITATIILTISKRNKKKSRSNDIGFVNYYEQQGQSTCCWWLVMCAGLQPRQKGTRAKAADYPGVFWGAVWPSEQKQKQGLGLGWEYREQAETPRYREERVQSRLVVDNGVKSLKFHSPESLVTPASVTLSQLRACALISWPELQSEASWSWSPDLMEHGGGWQSAEESGSRASFSRPDPSPPAAVPARPSGLPVSSSSGWTSSRSWPGSRRQLENKREQNTHQTGGRFPRHMSYSLSFHFSD